MSSSQIVGTSQKKTKQNKRRPNAKQGVPHDLSLHITTLEPGTSYVRLYARDGGGAKTFKLVLKAG